MGTRLRQLVHVLLVCFAAAGNNLRGNSKHGKATCVASFQYGVCVYTQSTRRVMKNRVLRQDLSANEAAEQCHTWCCERRTCLWWSVVRIAPYQHRVGGAWSCSVQSKLPQLAEATNSWGLTKTSGAKCSVGIKAGFLPSDWVYQLFSAKGVTPGGDGSHHPAPVDVSNTHTFTRTIFDGRFRNRMRPAHDAEDITSWEGTMGHSTAATTHWDTSPSHRGISSAVSAADDWHHWWHTAQRETTREVLWAYTIFIATLVCGALVRQEDEEDLHDRFSPTLQRCTISTIEALQQKSADCEDTCAICLCNWEQYDSVTELPCKHCFHQDCIARWLKRKDACPLCNAQVERLPLLAGVQLRSQQLPDSVIRSAN